MYLLFFAASVNCVERFSGNTNVLDVTKKLVALPVLNNIK